MKILHIVTGLGDGGAEAVLYRLCQADTGNKHAVISIMDKGKYGALLESMGVKVYCLNAPRGSITLNHFFQLYKLIKIQNTDVVQTWLYHSDLLGGIAAKLAGVDKVVWGVHHTVLDPKHSKLSTRIVAKVCSVLSYIIPDSIVYVAERGREVHEKNGYQVKRSVVIPNGYNLSVFQPDESARNEIKAELQLPKNTIVFGMVARFDPFKDHKNLLEAFSVLRTYGVQFKLLLVGTDMTTDNRELVSWIDDFGLNESVLCLGQRNDVSKVMNALDIHVLSSNSEAFPNVLCEAMACGVPCVSTDVGDASIIVGNTGLIVPISDSKALAGALNEIYKHWLLGDKSWIEKKECAQARIASEFSIDTMVQRYNEVWK